MEELPMKKARRKSHDEQQSEMEKRLEIMFYGNNAFWKVYEQLPIEKQIILDDMWARVLARRYSIRHLSIKEVADELGISCGRLRGAITTGRVQTRQEERHRYFLPCDILGLREWAQGTSRCGNTFTIEPPRHQSRDEQRSERKKQAILRDMWNTGLVRKEEEKATALVNERAELKEDKEGIQSC